MVFFLKALVCFMNWSFTDWSHMVSLGVTVVLTNPARIKMAGGSGKPITLVHMEAIPGSSTAEPAFHSMSSLPLNHTLCAPKTMWRKRALCT
jgi:hypothetical protein